MNVLLILFGCGATSASAPQVSPAPTPTHAPVSAAASAPQSEPLPAAGSAPAALPQAGAPDTFSLVFVGDWGTSNREERVVAQSISRWCHTASCDAGALLGDNFYPEGVASVDDPLWTTAWLNMYDPLGLVWHPALGNHDHLGNPAAQVEYSARSKTWAMPAQTYVWHGGPVDFFVIDSDVFDMPQARWLDEQLAASTAAWKVVYGHHPVYSNGYHGNNDALKNMLLPVLVKNHVQLYLAGHDHDKQVLKTSDPVGWIIVGTGAEVRPTLSGANTVYASSRPGFGYLRFTSSEARLQLVAANDDVEFETTFPRQSP